MSRWMKMLFKKIKVLLLLAVSLVSCLGFATNAFANPAYGSVDAYWLAEVDTRQAAKLVERKTGGKVLAVTEEERNGKPVYRVKVLLPEGRIRKLFVNKESGAISG